MAKIEKKRKTVSAAQRSVSKAAGTKKKAGGAAAAVFVVLLLVAAVGIYACGTRLINNKVIYPNVRVAGADVGGMAASEAMQTVQKAVAEAYTASVLEVHLPDRMICFDPEQTNVALDVDLAIEKAVAYGRSEGPFKAVYYRLICMDRSQDLPLETALKLDTEYLRTRIHETAAAVKTAPQDSVMDMDQAMTKVTVQVGVSGRSLDTEGLYEAVYNAFQSGNMEPLSWEYEIHGYKGVDIAGLHQILSGQITDAYYDDDAHEIIEGVSGYQFDLQAAQTALTNAEEGARLEFPLIETAPDISAQQLTEQMFGTILEQRSSVYVNNPKRTENLRLACRAINGTIINPGEVFSFNQIVGERTEEKGYQPATIYGGDGESVDGVGGGVCQVASTIYYAALYLDLETVMREPHMYIVTYVPAGCDATIYWDSGLDYKFRNNREHPIKIQANIDGGSCNITFWGVKENDNYVTLTAPQTLETWSEPDEEKVDETKPAGYRELKQGAYTGSKVLVIKKVFDASGSQLREDKLYSTYKARPRLYIVGPPPELVQPEPDPWEEPEPDLPWNDPEVPPTEETIWP